MTTSFKESGLLLDISRRAYPPEAVKAFISYIKAAGGRYLQLHFSDDENYAVESELLGQQPAKGSPEENGLYLNPVTGKYFLSKAQLADIVAHAAAEGIELIPELGSPGHMGGIFALYGAKYGAAALDNGFKNAYSELRYTTPAAIEFVQNLYAEVIGMFPGIKRFHIGGDEHGATYNDAYNAEFVEYANKQAAFLKARGLIPRMWNDGVMVSTLSELDKSIEITFWAWDGDKPAERERLIAIRAGMDDLIKAGFKVYNCNSYYTYSVPRGVDRISGDANYAAVDGYANWDLTKWDGNREIPDNRKVNPRDVAGSAMSIWGELLDSSQTWTEILEALKPHISAVFYLTDLQNLKDDNMTRMFTRRQKPTENIVPSAIYATGDTTGVTLHIADKEGTKLIPVSGLSEEDLQTVEGAKNDAQTAAQAAAQAKADADKQAAAAAAAKADADTAKAAAEQQAAAAAAAKLAADNAKTTAEQQAAAAAAAKTAADEAKATAQQQAQSAQQQATAAAQAKTESAAILEQMRQAQNNSGALTAEQQAALERFAAQAGTGSMMQIAYLTDVSNTTTGTTVDTLEIGYYSSASTKGGGLFKRVDWKTPVQTGIIVATKDSHKFQRVVEGGRYELEMFGYVPGGTDDSNVFFAAVKAVAAVGGRLVLPKNGALYIDASSTGAKFIPAGIKEIDGNGCTLYLINPTNNEIWLADATGDLEIHHLVIRPGEGAARSGGIFGRGGSRVHIHHCDIYSKQNHNILCRMISMVDGYQVERWEVHDNILEVDRGINITETTSPNGAYHNILFDLHQIDPNNTNNNMDTRWVVDKAVPNAGGRRHRNHKVYNNDCKGGRYGICLYFSEGSVVRDNRTENNTRGIVLQDKSRGNKIYNNQIYDYTTGILLAYEPELNEVYNNTLYRRAGWGFNANGQGHIMCYVQPTRNTIRGNKCFCDDDGSPTWGIMVAVNATGNIVEDNEIYGKVGRAAIVLESSWGGTADNAITYNVANPNWSTMDSIGNIIRNNIIEVSVRVPGIVLCSRNDDTVVRKLTGTIVSGNQFGAASANTQYIRLITQDAAGISGTIGYLNTYPPTATASNFIMGAAANWAKLSPEVNRASVAFES